MNGVRKITIGGVEYPLGKFTVGQVARLVPLLQGAPGIGSVAEADATQTIIHVGLQSGGYAGSYAEFQNLSDVTFPELSQAKVEIGLAIGYFEKKDATPGEAAGTESPLPS